MGVQIILKHSGVFIHAGNTISNLRVRENGGQYCRQKASGLAGDFIDDVAWNVGSLGQYLTCHIHGALLLAGQLISLANISDHEDTPIQFPCPLRKTLEQVLHKTIFPVCMRVVPSGKVIYH
jgi:hypothetical protein